MSLKTVSIIHLNIKGFNFIMLRSLDFSTIENYMLFLTALAPDVIVVNDFSLCNGPPKEMSILLE